LILRGVDFMNSSREAEIREGIPAVQIRQNTAPARPFTDSPKGMR
jgi:hypothetical protein